MEGAEIRARAALLQVCVCSFFMGEEEGSSALTLSHPNLELPPAGTEVRRVRDLGGSRVELSLRTVFAPWAGVSSLGCLYSPLLVFSVAPPSPGDILLPSRVSSPYSPPQRVLLSPGGASLS